MLRWYIDLALALLLLPFSVPIVLIAAIAIKLDSPGPVFFVQERIGYKKRIFKCYKLRTMTVDAPNAASHIVGANHVTPVGRWLRKFKLDELPQLWNVLKGDMRFVGPRPGLPNHEALTTARDAQGVFGVLPGITGLAQINRIDMSDPERLAEWDRRYIENSSLIMDLKLMIQTVTGSGRGDAAK